MAITQAQKVQAIQNRPAHSVVFTHDFSRHGGAVGDVNTGIFIPAGGIVTKLFLEKVTAYASAGGTGTVALKLVSANDLLSAVDADTLSAVINTGIPTGTPATMVKNTNSTETEIILSVATEALTAGKYNIHVEYK